MQSGLECRVVGPTIPYELSVERLQPEPCPAPGPGRADIGDGSFDGWWIGPVGAEEYPAGSADDIRHVWQQAKLFVDSSLQIVDHDRAPDAIAGDEFARVSELLLD